MAFTVYGHEIISGSDIGMHFSATFDEARIAVAEYREAMILIDPTAEPTGRLSVHELVLRLPDVEMMVDLLNWPSSLFASCLISSRVVESSE